ncbi:alpha/beta fold hydrolase [Pseudonocardia eucalypti]|uniref:Alpha/beta fold hydrolase n=1 Tax=Pseudonocardia eucalypti TaxID=648755 RepID=A0ABP9Q333_9PSEU|nr:pimeloyl-ACP methyl ester carboxylesterase [Pseudonocardia eucalypti]
MTEVAELIAGLGEYREVELPAGPLRYRERGSGRPLVFLHGGLANGDLWRGVVPRLAADYRCIVPDLPKGSHRLPMRPDADLAPPGMARLVVDFLDALGLDRVTLVTNDSGGAVGQMVAAAHPDRVDRLVLSACDTYGQLPPRYLKPLRLLCFLPGAGELMSRAWLSPLVHRPFFASIVKHGTPPEVLRSYQEPLRDAGIRRDLIKFFRGCAPRHTRAAARGLATFPRRC